MPGQGAWFYGNYKYGMDVPDHRAERGIFAFKQELIYRGFSGGIKLELPIFGNSVRDRTKDFQRVSGLVQDGEIGPKTARYLLWARTNRVQIQFSIPNRRLARLLKLESGYDPVAEGVVDPEDEGLAQIHRPFFPEITLEEAWDPSFAISWAGAKLAAGFIYCDDDWDGAVAAYNVGSFYAREWVRAGKPESGGPLIGGQDVYARAHRYVELVDRQVIFG